MAPHTLFAQTPPSDWASHGTSHGTVVVKVGLFNLQHIVCFFVDYANEVSIYTMDVHLVDQKASTLQERVYNSKHKGGLRSTAIVPNSNTRVGLEDIPGIPDIEAGVRMTAGCNATITFQVIGGKTESIITGSPDSNDDEKLSIGYKESSAIILLTSISYCRGYATTTAIIYVICTFAGIIIIFISLRGYCIMRRKGREARVIKQTKCPHKIHNLMFFSG